MGRAAQLPLFDVDRLLKAQKTPDPLERHPAVAWHSSRGVLPRLFCGQTEISSP
jgi:hypothetical protein